MKAIIHQNFYWPGIRYAFQKEVTKYDMFQHTKRSTKRYGKLPDMSADEIPWNKICVGLIGPYKICRKGKYTLIPKSITIIYLVTGWFEVTQYNNRKVMNISNLVETTWLTRYPCPTEIMYDKGS